MNWYKKSQKNPISITSYIPQYGKLGISFNGGKTYYYFGVSPHIYEKITTLLKNHNYKGVNKILTGLSKNTSEEEKKQMKLFETNNYRKKVAQSTYDIDYDKTDDFELNTEGRVIKVKVPVRAIGTASMSIVNERDFEGFSAPSTSYDIQKLDIEIGDPISVIDLNTGQPISKDYLFPEEEDIIKAQVTETLENDVTPYLKEE